MKSVEVQVLHTFLGIIILIAFMSFWTMELFRDFINNKKLINKAVFKIINNEFSVSFFLIPKYYKKGVSRRKKE